jgi:hypothetical protein
VQIIPATAGNGAGVAVDHVYTAPGSYTVKVTATDDDGTSPAAALAISVQSVVMEGNSLAVGGSLTGGDTIDVSAVDTTGTNLNVTINKVFQGKFTPTDHILVYGQGGSDKITLKPYVVLNSTYYYIQVPAFLYGEGSGGDKLSAFGSAANNVLVGHGSNEVLTGGQGRDLLIAGTGSATLNAGSADDILIGGWTNYDLTSTGLTYDKKVAALEAIMAEWGRTDESYLQRVANLSNSTVNGVAPNGLGQNGGYFLNLSTVHDNGQADTFGFPAAAPLDWIFASAANRLLHQNPGDTITTIS